MIQITAPVDELKALQAKIAGLEMLLPDIVHDAGKKTADLIQDRVEGQGLATNGSFLDTPSSLPVGRYGQRHGRERIKKGLQVQKVDLSFTGQMWQSWGEQQKGAETGVGFKNNLAHDKAHANEELYDTVIFKPSEAEKQDIKRAIFDRIKNALKR